MQVVTQTAPFRDGGTACVPRVRFSVECAFPYLRKRGGVSRKSAFSNRCLTEKRILTVRETAECVFP